MAELRILQLHTRYRQRGGEDQVVDAEARVLKEAGHQVHQLIERNPENNIRAAGNLTLSPWNPLAMRRVQKAIEDFRPDVAHVHNTWFAMSPAVVRALKNADVPVVMTLHNYRLTCANGLLYRDGAPCELCIDSHPWHSVRYGCYRGSRLQSIPAAATIDMHQRLGTWTRYVHRFLVLTEFQRDLMIRAGLPQERLVVKPNFVLDPGPRPDPPSASTFALYVGRLSPNKGIDILVEAWNRARIDDLELLIVGDGPLRSKLESERPANARLLGTRPPSDVQSLMLRARAGIIPSRCYEGLPLVLLEFMASGTGVIGSSHGSLGPVINRLGPKWAVKPDVSELAQVCKTLNSGELCDMQGRSSRHQYDLSYTASSAANALVGAYNVMSQ